ncbi:MAG: protein kinase [bacterium]|nr:protein kinase [bacterium]
MVLPSVGPYELLGTLGTGGMSEVFRARDTRDDRLVAIKRLRSELAEGVRPGGPPEDSGKQARQRFQREARTVARLDHPAIVKLHDFISAYGADWLVMELVDGRTLRSVLREGPLSPERAVALAREIASGLAEAHGKDIVHRDLKTENVLVTRGGHAKIVDFGLARRVTHSDTLTGAQSILGTFRAMSPEQVRGETLDPRSDLFSFGILLYEMVCGCSPFAHSNDLEAMRLILGERQLSAVERNPDVPAPLSELIDQMLEKDPNLRPRTAQEVERSLDRVLGATPLSVDRDDTSDETLADVETPLLTDEATQWQSSGEQETVEHRPRREPRKRRPIPRVVGLAAAGLVALGGFWTAVTWPRALGMGIALTGALEPPAEALRVLEVRGVEAGTAWQPRRPVGDPAAAAAVREGLRHFSRHTRMSNAEARRSFQRAVDLEPGFAAGHAWLAATWGMEIRAGWNVGPAVLDRHAELVDRAYLLDPLEPRVHLELASGAIARGRWHKAIEHAETALELDSADPTGHELRGIALAADGRIIESTRALGEALRRSPRDPAAALTALALVEMRLGRRRRAIELLERVCAARPELVPPRAALALLHERAGRFDQAHAAVAEIQRVNPALTAERAVEGLVALAADGREGAARRAESLRRAGLLDGR